MPKGFPFRPSKPVAFVQLPDSAKEECDSNSYVNRTEANYIMSVYISFSTHYRYFILLLIITLP